MKGLKVAPLFKMPEPRCSAGHSDSSLAPPANGLHHHKSSIEADTPEASTSRMERKQKPEPASLRSMLTPSFLLANLAKIVLTMGLWLWYLALKTALQVAVEGVTQYLREQQHQLQELQEQQKQQQLQRGSIPLILTNGAIPHERRRHSSDESSTSSSQGTVRLRMRHSLRKRKEQILFGSPRSPGSPASPVSSPRCPSSPGSPASPLSTSPPSSSSPEEGEGALIYFHHLNGVANRRVR